jgi:hypothetical protein
MRFEQGETMNSEWQLITETIDGAFTSSPDSTARNNSGWSDWEILQAPPGAEGALVL